MVEEYVKKTTIQHAAAEYMLYGLKKKMGYKGLSTERDLVIYRFWKKHRESPLRTFFRLKEHDKQFGFSYKKISAEEKQVLL